MRLKRLEIQGFKSFARSVSLDFGGGITAIVGPNGSGKSNISDALRWVLGEQSAKSLRGQRMEDVIFAGSDGKKALGMAEVQLTLDNTEGFLPLDYSEVTVTRRVYRSGDSEFFINKQPCRLRDIHDLFTDTGLGREGYAIIGQGQIEAVLSVRSEDRRVLLEETAGIVKYRQRKEQALSKLEETGIDLLRVTDILHELESQLGPLSEQAKQARIYLDLAERLHLAELDYFHLNWKSLEQKWQQGEGKSKELQAEHEKWNQRATELEKEKARLETNILRLEEELEQSQQELMDLMEAYNQGAHTIELHQERLKNNASRSQQLCAIIEEKTGELEALDSENEMFQGDLHALLEQIKGQEEVIAQSEWGTLKLQEEQRLTQTQINKLKDDFFDFMRDLAERRNFKRSFGERKTGVESQIRANQGELEEANQRLQELEAQISDLHREEAHLKELLVSQEDSQNRLEREFEEVKVHLGKEQGENRRIEGQITQLNARVKSLQELEEGYEGYALGVRRIMQNSKMASLVLGTVADVITVPSGLETAFEVALGSGLQNLITKNEVDAKALIAWLQEVKGGRVTILPLDQVKGSEFSKESQNLLKQPGVLGSALDLLEFPTQYRSALASLLGRVVITENLDVALSLKRRLNSFARIVTKDGSVVFPTGAMTGGSLNNRTSGLLARKGELTELENKLQVLQDELEHNRQEEKRIAEQFSQIEIHLETLKQDHVQTRLQSQSTSQTLRQILQEEQNWKLLKEKLTTRSSEFEEILANLSVEQEQAASLVTQLEAEEEERRAHIAQTEALLTGLGEKLELANHDQTSERVQLAELKGVLENLRTKLANLEQRQKDAQRVQDQARLELAQIDSEKREHDQVILETTEANNQRQLKQGELRASLERKKQERQLAQKDSSALSTELVQTQKEQMQRERAFIKWEVELEQLARSREQILTVLGERELTLANILDRDVEVSEGSLKRTIDNLRRQIKDLGLVNPAAPQEYERVLERCSFLQSQLADLNEARESLQDVIHEMDKLCRTKLWEAYTKVREEFQRIFSQLFLGGKADLVLTDPESILTTGIEVMARPPGKKLQNLLLLSGGERALTAIALLFAIRKVKPTPFCVLDEIDAALDESNLQRFTELMEEFAKDTQFLVITHRPKTMEAAHTLYGVTMGEEAFSQIISVALN